MRDQKKEKEDDYKYCKSSSEGTFAASEKE